MLWYTIKVMQKHARKCSSLSRPDHESPYGGPTGTEPPRWDIDLPPSPPLTPSITRIGGGRRMRNEMARARDQYSGGCPLLFPSSKKLADTTKK
eukprot:CAMPEP_0114497432 /NCGR_PEP_ID=MMETSP0109-20121206/6324_1 /TAXON_ID=29199 /ORGANISM="Chlorarachnion reptans, Strain CCCM449" /LENGTH=93 /DNA_ID=CAMNT_0001674819 /DNA_START=491 /DNA_END=769 /DNA_ORIENTATION=-